MSDVVYRSHVRVERIAGPYRLATLPATDEPVPFGVHGEVASHYGVDPDSTPRCATTLDHVIAAAAG